jgi:CBS-domain-containing membrane protein
MISEKPVKEIMSTALVTARPDTTLPDALYLLKQYKIRRLPVVKNGVLVGIVTLTDLLEAGPSDAIALKAGRWRRSSNGSQYSRS